MASANVRVGPGTQAERVKGRKWCVEKFGGTEELKLVDFDVPVPKAGEVVVRVLCTDATYTDQLILHGMYRPLPPLPVTPGYCLIGVVDAVGAGCNLQQGARVAAMPQSGCLATHRVLPESLVVPCRADIAPEKAIAVVLTGVTAHQMLHRHTGKRINADAAILVHACVGGTGAMVVALAKIAGVKTIYGTCSEKNIAAAEQMGIKGVCVRERQRVCVIHM